MGKDILLDRYGRFYEFTESLAGHGHQVTGLCLSYHHGLASPGTVSENVAWHHFSMDRYRLAGLPRYLRSLPAIVEQCRPDLVIGCSDSLHVITSAWLARRYGIPCLVDLYDNFESYGLTRLPLLTPMFRRAVRQANGIAVVSPELADYIVSEYRPAADPVVIENAIPGDQFMPMDREESRKLLRLPADGTLIGTAGALDESRDITTLYDAFLAVAGQHADMHLVLAGRLDRRSPIPRHERIHYLGELDYGRIPYLFSALDIGVISNRAGAFGDYCFPQKLYEMLSCRLPVLAADVGAMRRLFGGFPRNLYRAGDADDLACALASMAAAPVLPGLPIPRWRDQGDRLNELAVQVCLNRS